MALFGQLLPLKMCVFNPVTLSIFVDLCRAVVCELPFRVSVTASMKDFNARTYRCDLAWLPSVVLSEQFLGRDLHCLPQVLVLI